MLLFWTIPYSAKCESPSYLKIYRFLEWRNHSPFMQDDTSTYIRVSYTLGNTDKTGIGIFRHKLYLYIQIHQDIWNWIFTVVYHHKVYAIHVFFSLYLEWRRPINRRWVNFRSDSSRRGKTFWNRKCCFILYLFPIERNPCLGPLHFWSVSPVWKTPEFQLQFGKRDSKFHGKIYKF